MIENIMIDMNRNNLSPLSNENNGDIIIRSFRIYEDILNEFIDFCENTSLKQYDVLSIFILEGLNKYKKK